MPLRELRSFVDRRTGQRREPRAAGRAAERTATTRALARRELRPSCSPTPNGTCSPAHKQPEQSHGSEEARNDPRKIRLTRTTAMTPAVSFPSPMGRTGPMRGALPISTPFSPNRGRRIAARSVLPRSSVGSGRRARSARRSAAIGSATVAAMRRIPRPRASGRGRTTGRTERPCSRRPRRGGGRFGRRSRARAWSVARSSRGVSVLCVRRAVGRRAIGGCTRRRMRRVRRGRSSGDARRDAKRADRWWGSSYVAWVGHGRTTSSPSSSSSQGWVTSMTSHASSGPVTSRSPGTYGPEVGCQSPSASPSVVTSL